MDIIAKISQEAALHGSRTVFRSRAGSMTYEELWQRSGRIASYIVKCAPGSHAPIPVYGHKDPMMLVCFLACVRSGHAYCPVDRSMPLERVQEIAEAVDAPFILAAEGEEDLELEKPIRILSRDELEKAAQEPTSISYDMRCISEDIFYIIFTSGSTGKPKGVQITVNDLNNYLQWSITLAGGIPQNSVFLNQAPFSFDLSVMDLYTALATGSTIVAVDKALQKDIPAMLKYLENAGIEYWVSTPSFADLCLGEPGFSDQTLKELKAFLFCGEALTKGTCKQLMKRMPQAKIINTYGPTESTVCVTEVEITQEWIDREGALPIGLPKPGTDIRIDPENGEMVICGDTVSPGYFGDEERTRRAFYRTEPGILKNAEYDGKVRAYRTGDKGHYDEDGMLYCDGRLDMQIKLHGYRIELGDIESNLLKLPGIDQAAVVPYRKDEQIESLTAFIVRKDVDAENSYEERKAVRKGLKELLPGYMVPKRVRFIREMPLTRNGKADRKKLEVMANGAV